MTTYNIGPGQTYETLAALRAGVTLQAGDIVDAGGSTQSVWATGGDDGADGSPIIYQNVVIDGDASTVDGIPFTGSNYISLNDFSISNCTTKGINGNNALHNSFSNIAVTNIPTGFYFLNSIDITASNLSAYNATNTGILLYGNGAQDFGVFSDILVDGNAIGFYANNGAIATLNRLVAYRNTSYGLYIKSTTSFTASVGYIDASELTTGAGVEIATSSNVSLDNYTVVNSTESAISILTSVDSIITDSTLSDSLDDGLSIVTNSTGTTVKRVKSTGNGDASSTVTGDAFTAHTGCTGNKFHFNYSTNNLNTAYAMVADSTGEIYHHSSYNDGMGSPFFRATLYLVSTGAWTVKNSVFYNTNGYRIAEIGASTTLTSDYNCYISNTGPTNNGFKVGATAMNWATWVATVGNETHSIYIHEDSGSYKVYLGSAPTVIDQTLTYCPINEDGTLVLAQDNPLIDTGITITGVNDGGELDLFGYGVYGNAPNIGACQQYGTSRNMGMPDLIDGLDGLADGDLESTGTLVSANRYEIVTTETDHFGSGVVVGDRVTGLTTALDANNTVKQISPAEGELVVEWMPMFDYDVSGIVWSNIINVGSVDLDPLRFNTTGALLLDDGPNAAAAGSVNWQAGTLYTVKAIWGTTHPTYPGVSKMQLIITDGTTPWASSVVDFDGSFDPADFLSFGWENEYWQKFKSSKLLKEATSWV